MDRPWMNDPATEKQINRVREIERLFKIKYEGPMTKGGVGPFIGQHRENFFAMEHEEISNESLLHFLEED
jgi:hypothetical protein